jgi:hypothetical protein
LSRLHTNVRPEALSENAKAADVLVVGFAGCESIVGAGGTIDQE